MHTSQTLTFAKLRVVRNLKHMCVDACASLSIDLLLLSVKQSLQC